MIDFSNPGRMIAPSKTRYYERFPDHIVCFNANVFSRSPVEKIWWGDLDLTLDGEDLQRLANERGTEIVVLREMDGRFDKEISPDFSKIVASFTPMASANSF